MKHEAYFDLSADNPASVSELKRRVASLQNQVDAQARALRAFHDISVALTSPQYPERLLQLVLSRASSLLDADRATLFLLDEETGQLHSQLTQGGCEQAICLSMGQGIAGMVLQSGEPIRVADAYNDPRFSRRWDEQTGYCTRSILAVPMKNHAKKTVGVLQVLNKLGGAAFGADDEALLTMLASQAAIFLDNVNLYGSALESYEKLAELSRRLQRKVLSLDFLIALENAMTRAGQFDKLARTLLQSMVQVTGAKAALMLVWDGTDSPCEVFVVHGNDRETMIKKELSHPVGTLARAMERGKPVRLKVMRAKSTEKEFALLGFDAKRVLAVPMLQQQGHAFGVIAVYDRAEGSSFSDEFTQDDEDLMRLVASAASSDIRLLWLRQAQQVSDRLSTVGRLLSGVLHDMKTPMAVISGYVQMLVDTDDGAQRKEFGKLVLAQFEYITAMQREVLAFARGERTLLVRKVYLEAFMSDFEAQLRKGLEGRNVRLHVDVLDRGVARFDQVKMMRALYNLARNAVEAMGDGGGTLTIVVQREENELVFVVRDTGPGVPERIQKNLFAHFVTANKVEGTGLGLAIVKKIMQEHGGTVTMSSSSKGAEFTLRLPQ